VLRIGTLRFGAVVAALLLPALPAAADDSLFDEGRAQSALEKIFDKANHPAKILSLELRPLELEVELQDPAQPKHIDSWTDTIELGTVRRLVFGSETISGPRPVDPTLPNPDLDANLFEFKPADAAIVPKLVAAAIKRAQLEDAAAIGRMELRRQLHLVPEPSSGAPEWSIEVTSGRERAEIYADLAGRITHANLDGTRRAAALDYLNGGKELDDLVAAIADALGKEPTIKSVIVYNHSLAFEALNPEHPDRYSGFTAGLNGVYRDLLLDSVVNIAIPGQEPPGRFAITDVDWSLLPKLEQAARERLQLPGGKIGLVKLTKPASGVGAAQIEWEINIQAAGDSAVAGYVVFDVKGNVLNTHYPPGKGPKLDLFDPASYASAFDGMTSGLGQHAQMVELVFWPDKVLITTKDPQKPDGLVVFEYRGESLTRSIMPPLDWPTFGPDWFFDLSQAQPVGARWAQLQQDALTRLGLTGGKIERITISKQKLFMPRNDRVLIEVRAEAGRRDGRVVYDLNGSVVDIVTP
jgi:hypothetical protein